MIACPRCGGQLPPQARFCAHCGAPLGTEGAAPAQFWPAPARPAPVSEASASRREVRLWVTILYWIGAALSFGVAALYAAGLALPGALDQAASAQKTDPGQLRLAVIFVVMYFAALCLSHVVAAIGLTLRKPWAKVVATLAAALWVFTCVGVPVVAVVIFFLWRPVSPSRSAGDSQR